MHHLGRERARRWRGLRWLASGLVLLATSADAQNTRPTPRTPAERETVARPDSATVAVGPATAVRISVVDSLASDADPGSVVSVPLRIRHDGDQTVPLVSSLRAPSGWRSITGTGEFSVQPSEDLVRIVSLSVPHAARPGAHTLTFSVRGIRDSLLRASATVLVRVRSRPRVTLQLVSAPQYVLAGERYVARFLASNTGNVDVTARVRVRSAQPLDVAFDSGLTLPAGASRTIDVTVTTAHPDRSIGRHDLLVQLVSSVDNSQGMLLSEEAEAASTVLLLRRGPDDAGARQVYTSSMEVTASGPGAGFRSIALSGSGLIDGDGTVYVDYRARAVTPGPSLLGEWDEYRLRVTAPRFELLLGDQVFGLSNLTEPGRYAFGAGGHVTAGAVQAGGFVSRWRHARTPSTEQAFHLGANLTNSLFVGANVLDRSDSSRHRIWSATALLDPRVGGIPSLELEYAGNAGGEQPLARGRGAWSARLRSQGPAFSYDLSTERRDPTFDGYLAGIRETLASTSIRLSRAATLMGRLALYDADTASIAATTIGRGLRQREIGVDFLGIAQLSALDASRAVDGPRQPQDGLERSLRIRVTPLRGAVVIVATGEVGEFQDRLTGVTRPTRRTGLDLRAQSGDQSLSVFAERALGPSLYSPDVRERTSAGVNGSLGLGRTRVGVSAYGMREEAVFTRLSGVVDGSVSHQLPFGHRFFSRFRIPVGGPQLTTYDLVWQAGYVVPLAVPRIPSRPEASLRVRVRDGSSGRPVPNALVRINERVTLTDARGIAELTGLPPGRHQVSVVPRDGTIGAVALRGGTRAVALDGNRRVATELFLLPAARLTGTLRLAPGPGDTSVAAGADTLGLAAIAISLAGLSDTLRVATDREGRFEFTSVAPGSWQILVPAEVLPPEHVLARRTDGLLLEPGQHQDVELRVVPHRRQLRILTKQELEVPVRSPTPPTLPTQPTPRPPPPSSSGAE